MKSIAYQVHELVITANGRHKIYGRGRFARVLYNSSTTDLSIEVGDSSVKYRMPQGVAFKMPDGEFFEELTLVNNAGASITVHFAVSEGEILDSRASFSGSLTTNSTPDTLESPAAIAVPTTAPGSPQIAAAASLREIVIQNNGAFELWVGDSNVDGAANRGHKIPVDGSLILNTAAAVYMRANGGATTASVLKLSKS